MDQLNQILERINRDSIERDKRLAEQLQNVIRQQALTGQIAAIEQQKQLLASVYQRASAYSNLVILAGYAGLFAIWQLTREHLDKEITILTALFASTSIILFVGFETYKMISHAIFIRKLDRVLLTYIPEPDRLNAWQQAWINYAQIESRIWLYFLIPMVLTGFGAGGLLIYTFIRFLS